MPSTARLVLVSSRSKPQRAGYAHLSTGTRCMAPKSRARLTPMQVIATACGAAAAIVLQVAYALAAGGAPF